MPEVLGPFVGGVEIICGALVVVGLLTRLAAIPLLIDISVAILSTKIPILLGHGFWNFTLAKLPRYGFLSMMHEARTDFSMLLGLIFLLIVGAGHWSLDSAWFNPKHAPRHESVSFSCCHCAHFAASGGHRLQRTTHGGPGQYRHCNFMWRKPNLYFNRHP